jgi:PAS domain S-box-containing protein
MSDKSARRSSIITRLTLMVAGILALAVLVTGGLALFKQQRQLKQALEAKATSLVQFMAQVSPLSLLSFNFVEMNNNVKKVVQTDEEVVYAIIINEYKTPMASFFKQTDPLVTDTVRDLVAAKKVLAAAEAMKQSGRVLEVTAPILAGKERLGSAIIGLSFDKMRRALLVLIMAMGIVLVVIIGFSITLLLVMLRQILRPVQTLTAAATRVSTGDLNVVLTGTDRTDELGILTRAFASMTAQLRDMITGLRNSERRLADIINLLPDATFAINPDGEIILWNRTAEEFTGAKAEEMLGKGNHEYSIPFYGVRRPLLIDLALEPSAETEKLYPYFRRDDGKVIGESYTRSMKHGEAYMLAVAAPLYDSEGTITGAIESVRDITARKQTEEALRRERALLRCIIDSASDLIFIKDRDSAYLGCNKASERFIGLPESEQIAKTDFDFFDQEMASLVRENDRQVVEEGKTLRTEEWVTYPDGHRVLLDTLKVPFYGLDGEIQGLVGICRDITGRKQAEEALSQLAAIVEFSEDAIIGKSLEGTIVSWNRGAERLYGYREEEVKGCSVSILIPDDHAGEVAYILDHVNQGKPIEHYETARVRKDGSRVEVSVTISPICDAGGKIVGASTIARDITERKKTEADLRKLNEELERRVIERTADLNRRSVELSENQQALMNIVEDLNLKTEELRQANAKLQELDRLKSMFIASMSHELRTPLNSIIGFSSILHDEWIGPVNAEQKENLAIILRSGKHLLSLINDVIDVSKIEAGKIESVPEEFDLHDLITEAVSLVRKDLDEKGLDLQVAAPHQQMHMDRRRLLQCVLNLLSNAMKFTEQGGVTVEGRIVQNPGEAPEAGVAEISVTDTGIGIREEDLPKMCQPFVRLASPLQATVPGTGLGLYLSRKLAAEVLKGDILVTSEYGKGSRFTIKIPVRVP